jgi:predicted metal-dependent enzyme (double-stranded beta helix superfamily)
MELSGLTGTVRSLIEALEREAPQGQAELLRVVERAAVDERDLQALHTFDHDPNLSYGRRCLWQGPHIGVYAMSWAPGDFTALHGHGRAEFGLVLFLGAAAHRRYDVRGNEVRLAAAETVPAGTAVGVCTGDFYHAMGNSGDRPFMTLHIYGAYGATGCANDGARVFELETDRITVTGGSAYLHMPAQYRKSYATGIRVDLDTRRDYYACIRPFFDRIGRTDLLNA